MGLKLNLPVVLFTLVVALSVVPTAWAFGAGNIPGHSFLEGKAFRHGDIEDVLADLIKKGGGFLGRGHKFGGLDIKRVYFGNWLRDYSQAMDIAGLSKLSKQTILNLCMALGFLAHGYATGEFEVTEDRLGVYEPVQHIDNPKGYGNDVQGRDPRTVDPRLRGPVMDIEMEVDPRTGMKNYIANENGNWDTSAAYVRRNMVKCIETGRRAYNGGNDADMHEAYRLLGTFLHTLEDFPAHSNWVELSLRRLGYNQVFCHVGDSTHIQTPAGLAPCLVTGSFGGADFIHSLLGEATDHISEASVSDLAKAMDGAKSRSRGVDGKEDNVDQALMSMMGQFGGGPGTDLSRQMQDCQNIRSRAAAGQSMEMSPQELHATMWQVLSFRDNVVKAIEMTIERIPGLSALVDRLTETITRFVFTTLEPILKPIMGQATQTLLAGSTQVIDSADQYEVFDKPNASDPTHSFLSKDHFALILNEPAGNLAQIILRYTVKAVVNAWDNPSVDPVQAANDCLRAFHHPYFYDDSSPIQREMGAYVKSWIEQQPAADKQYILNSLTKDAVRNHRNKRKGHVEDQIGHGAGGQYNSILSPEKVSAFASQHIPGASGVIGTFNQATGYVNNAQQYIGRRDVDERGFPGGSHDQGGYQQPHPPQQSQYQGGGGFPEPGYQGGGGHYQPPGPPPGHFGPPPPGPPPGQWGGHQGGGMPEPHGGGYNPGYSGGNQGGGWNQGGGSHQGGGGYY